MPRKQIITGKRKELKTNSPPKLISPKTVASFFSTSQIRKITIFTVAFSGFSIGKEMDSSFVTVFMELSSSRELHFDYVTYKCNILLLFSFDSPGALFSQGCVQIEGEIILPSIVLDVMATRRLLATDHVILNHGQVTWTTPELARPLLTTTPHQWEDVSDLGRFNVHLCRTRRVFSGTGLELVTGTAMAGSDVVQSGRPIFDDFFQPLWPSIGNNTANVVFQRVKRLWLIRIDQ
ncbi:uncharacterized protein TNCV_2422631 [Trichonephila clavipes]|nr:uncharacterized protein TNCV_2422631 [Trichonephila clavipes]